MLYEDDVVAAVVAHYAPRAGRSRARRSPLNKATILCFRNVTELVLCGVRGSMRALPQARSQVNMIETRKREHSRKPDEQYEFIESC